MAVESYAYGYYNKAAIAQPLPQIESKPKTKSKTRVNATPKVFSRVLVVALFALVFCVVLRYTVINEMLTQNTQLERELQSLTAANEQASVYLDRTTDLKKVEEVAKNQLGMDFPKSYQTVNVTLNMENKVVKSTPVKYNLFEKLKQATSKTLEYLY